MKNQFRILRTPERHPGWGRAVRRLKNMRRGTVMIDFGRIAWEVAS